VGFRVLEGTLEFEAQGTATKIPAQTHNSVDMPAGRAFRVTVGDQLVMPDGVVHSARTVGDTPARILGLAIFGAAPVQDFPPGITFEPLVLGQVESLPASPATVTATRSRSAPGHLSRIGGDGPRIVFLESGRSRASLIGGAIAYWRGTGPFAPATPLASDDPVELSEGDGLLVQSGAAVNLEAVAGSNTMIIAAVGDADDTHPEEEFTARNRAAATRFVYDLWQAGDLSPMDQFFDPSFVNHTPLRGQRQGSSGVRQFFAQWRAAFPDMIVTIDLLVSAGDAAVIRWTSRGHHLAPLLGVAQSGRYVTISGITELRLRGGRIAHMWQHWAVLSFLDQAGVMPKPSRYSKVIPQSG